MKRFTITTMVALATLAIATSVNAQTSPATPTPTPGTSRSYEIPITVNGDLNRAKNLARQAIERANGGLNLYRAEAAMHGPTANAPYVDNGNGSWTFTFMGGTPGYTTPTVESVVTVFREDWRVVIEYNGAPRAAR